MLRTALPLVVVGLLASVAPAMAGPMCFGSSSGVQVSVGAAFGGKFTEDDQNKFDQMRLNQMGIEATRVERWNNCIRAWVRQADGRETMEFYDPQSYERVQ
ncbi:hypothetical protein [Devosia sp. 2618]|uniref:hypothetical protein n=1 Tax=Devosia sp. 2618 TaxID=3156454 RepID=UPI0033916C34